TANALAGNDDMFKQNGFDDFISKPINARHLDTVLNKYIRDRNSPETERREAANAVPAEAVSKPPEVFGACGRGAPSRQRKPDSPFKNGESRKRPKFLVPLIFTAVVLLTVLYQHGEYDAAGRDSGSPFYQNLAEAPAYVKRGFDPNSLLEIPAENSGGWARFEYPPFRIMDSPLPDLPYRPFLSPWGMDTEEFTVAVLFEMDGQSAAFADGGVNFGKNAVPGIFLSSIGENWEIFLNGKLIRSETHLDDAGEIVSRRTWRDVYFPFETALLVPGTNILTFRIIGDPAYDATGLYYASRNYIDDYGSIEARQRNFFLAALCGVFGFAGFYYLTLFLSIREKRELFNLYFSLFSFLLCIYAVVRNDSMVNSLIPDSDISIRLEYASLFMLLPVFGLFVENMGRRKTTKPTWVFLGFCALSTISQTFFCAQFGDEVLAVWNVFALIYLTYVFFHDIAAFYIRARRESKRAEKSDETDTRFGNILFGSAMVYACVIYDTAGVILFNAPFSIFLYGVFAFHILITFSLSQRFAGMYKRLGESNAVLEAAVQERTLELERQVEIAVRASKAKSNFLADMSHEIRTPMNAIMGIAQIELQKGDLTENQTVALEKIYNAGDTLLGIINSILDLSKIETGKPELNPAEYDIPSLINDVARINAVRIGSKRIEFLLDIDENLPLKMFGDELRLKQILNNLLSNAVKYTEEGYVKLSASHTAENGDVFLRFAVEDTGQGLKPEDKDRLFSKHPRFNAEANRFAEGTGISLNITENLVTMMDGKIEVESEYGKGSVFTVTVKQKAVNGETVGSKISRRPRDFAFADGGRAESLPVVREPYNPQMRQNATDPELLAVFRRDIQKTVAVLRETVENGNTKLFTTAVHGAKSALANIGETELSKTAARLESAGRGGDTGYISANAERFAETLEALAEELTPKETGGADGGDVTEDDAYLAEQLRVIKSACEDYDDTAAYAALDRLGEKRLKKETSKILDEIRGDLFLNSDFEGAAKRAEKFINELAERAYGQC
ncbi:MAG: hypothetical protein LBI38_05900, partial [Oscillospiraceae bacterium]|nr:hypothetical protein [Oscillospiraceae bacterium]